MKISVVGATGLVGRKMLQVLEERNIIPDELIAAASEKSAGHTVPFNGESVRVRTIGRALAAKLDVALFSAGADVSLKWAPQFAAAGCFVIDNSSAWRMDDAVPLIVPEINAGLLSPKTKIIANPNCSTIQMVMALAPLHREFRIQRVVVSTYQSVTGSGMKAVRQLENERGHLPGEEVYPHPIDLNVIPHAGHFDDSGYTTEETKLVNETKKILDASGLRITATAVRVPVYGGHSEAVNVTFEKDFSIHEIKHLLSNTPGVTVLDDPLEAVYPMPLFAREKDEVFVGRIRKDLSHPKALNLWIVSDNLRKGAATNAVQIAQYLMEKKWV